jgi:hypothetical protein
VERGALRTVLLVVAALLSTLFVVATVAVPTILLLRADDKTLGRWADIGQALSPIGIFFSGLAFIGIALTLALQRRELQNQREELAVTRQEQQRSNEVALRQLHTDLIKLALSDHELLEVWPPLEPGVAETRKDHYCNLILNLQKVAYEAGTIELDELRGALRYFMTSPDVYEFWAKARVPRIAISEGDAGEDFFTREVDQAFINARRPDPPASG